MKVVIYGGGNIGTYLAIASGAKGHETIIYTPRFNSFCKTLKAVDENDNVIMEGSISCATDDAEVAFKDADFVVVTVPDSMKVKAAEVILPYVHDGMIICLMPGYGAGEFAFEEAINKGAILFGPQRVPCVARLTKYGSTVRTTGFKKSLLCAAIPSGKTMHCCKILSRLLEMPCEALPNYLCVTMTPSNPILHTSRLYSMFKDYCDGKTYPGGNPLFYEGWTDFASEVLVAMDDELQDIIRNLPEFDLRGVQALRYYYDGPDPKDITKTISNIKAFKGITSPVLVGDGYYVPDFDSRYFSADFPYGLAVLVQLGELTNTKTPQMNTVLDWYKKLCPEMEAFDFAMHGIKTREDLVKFYSK